MRQFIRVSVHKFIFCGCPAIEHLLELFHRWPALVLLVVGAGCVEDLLALVPRGGLVQELFLRLGADALEQLLDLLHLQAGDVQVLHAPLLLLEELVLPRRCDAPRNHVHRGHCVFV